MKKIVLIIFLAFSGFLFADSEGILWGISREEVLSRYHFTEVVKHPNPRFNPEALSLAIDEWIVSFTFNDEDSLILIGYFRVFPVPTAKRLFEEMVEQFTEKYGEPEILDLLPYHRWFTAQEKISLLLFLDEMQNMYISLTFYRLPLPQPYKLRNNRKA